LEYVELDLLHCRCHIADNSREDICCIVGIKQRAVDRRYKCDIFHPFKLVEPHGPAFHVFQFQVVPSTFGTIFQLKLGWSALFRI
jgi:hypothetical protein